jgi:acyl-CoA thioesterase
MAWREPIVTAKRRASRYPRDLEKGVKNPMIDAQATAEQSAQILWQGDRASQMLGMRIVSVAPGAATLAMMVREDMVNGHRICHGGMIFMLADSAFAFACNSYGDNTVAASATIDFLAPGREGDELTATAQETWRSGRSGLYEIVVTNQSGARLAIFRGRSHQIAGRLL